MKFGQGNLVSNPLENTYIFSFIYFGPHSLVTQDRPATPSFPFNFFPLKYLFLRRGVVGSNPTPFYIFSSFSLTFLCWPWGCGIKPPHPHFIFVLFSFLNLPKISWVLFPNASPLFYFILLHKCAEEVVGSIPTHLSLYFSFIYLLNLPKRSWVWFPHASPFSSLLFSSFIY